MKKTYREHFAACSEPWASKALQYMEEDGQTAEYQTYKLSDAVGGAFLWSATSEGVSYWRSIYWKVKQKESDGT